MKNYKYSLILLLIFLAACVQKPPEENQHSDEYTISYNTNLHFLIESQTYLKSVIPHRPNVPNIIGYTVEYYYNDEKYNFNTSFDHDVVITINWVEDVLYEIVNEEVFITGSKVAKNSKIEILASYQGYPTIGINDSAFISNEYIERVYIAEGIKYIGNQAFAHNSKLSSIELPNSIETIGESAFYSCSRLTNIKLPPNLVRIEAGTFFNCTLYEIDIPAQINYIGALAFASTPLYSLNLPRSIQTIGWAAFSNCKNIKEIIIPEGIIEIAPDTFNSCVTLKKVSLPSSLTKIGYQAFSGCNYLSEINLPSNLTIIGEAAFANCVALKTIILPDSLTTIEKRAFANCSLIKEITIPENVKIISEGLFRDCSRLENIILHKKIEKIEKHAFLSCLNIINVYYPGSEEAWEQIDIDQSWDLRGSSGLHIINNTDKLKFNYEQ